MAHARTEQDLLEELGSALENSDTPYRVDSFEAAGVLTRDAGMVVRTRDGREFQITIVRSR